MEFRVRGLDANANVVSLDVSAADEEDVRGQLQAQQLAPLSIVALSGRQGRSCSRRAAFSLLLFSQEFHALLSAGLNVIEVLDTLIDRETYAARQGVLRRLAASVAPGDCPFYPGEGRLNSRGSAAARR